MDGGDEESCRQDEEPGPAMRGGAFNKKSWPSYALSALEIICVPFLLSGCYFETSNLPFSLIGGEEIPINTGRFSCTILGLKESKDVHLIKLEGKEYKYAWLFSDTNTAWVINLFKLRENIFIVSMEIETGEVIFVARTEVAGFALLYPDDSSFLNLAKTHGIEVVEGDYKTWRLQGSTESQRRLIIDVADRLSASKPEVKCIAATEPKQVGTDGSSDKTDTLGGARSK